jgi:hypothetical protein
MNQKDPPTTFKTLFSGNLKNNALIMLFTEKLLKSHINIIMKYIIRKTKYLYHNLQMFFIVFKIELLKLKLMPEIKINKGTSITSEKVFIISGTYDSPLQKHVCINIIQMIAIPLKKSSELSLFFVLILKPPNYYKYITIINWLQYKKYCINKNK